MDKKLIDEIIKTVERSSAEAYETYNERFLSPQELCNQFQMITPSWIKDYGHLLPRCKIAVKTKTGRVVGTRYAYAQHKIAAMIARGEVLSEV